MHSLERLPLNASSINIHLFSCPAWWRMWVCHDVWHNLRWGESTVWTARNLARDHSWYINASVFFLLCWFNCWRITINGNTKKNNAAEMTWFLWLQVLVALRGSQEQWENPLQWRWYSQETESQLRRQNSLVCLQNFILHYSFFLLLSI